MIVLQHPDEAKNPKGSAIIAELGLEQYMCWKGEDFNQHQRLESLLDESAGKTAILYPEEGAEWLEAEGTIAAGQDKPWADIENLIVIDGTWRKASKIWQINPRLHQLRRYRFREDMKSAYRIRKAPEQSYLSTVESIVYALRAIEDRPQVYADLLDLFGEMIDFQIKSMGKETYENNYLKK